MTGAILDGTTSVISAAISSIDGKGHRHLKAGTKSIVQDANPLHPQRVDGAYELTVQMSKTGRLSRPRNYLIATANARNPDGSKKYPLHIRTSSLATRVLFSERHDCPPEAIGIEYLAGSSLYAADPKSTPRNCGIKRQAHATREVVISAGVFNTPQLLKLSGIGPKSKLQHPRRHRSPWRRLKPPRQL
jgi:choline dehydrogenase